MPHKFDTAQLGVSNAFIKYFYPPAFLPLFVKCIYHRYVI